MEKVIDLWVIWMKIFFEPILALIWKDLLLEIRAKNIVFSLLVFSLLSIVIFNFAIDPSPQLVVLVAPGILWISFVFGGMLGMARSFALEADGGNLRNILIAPVGRDSIFIGKMAGSFLFMLLVEICIFPVFAIFFNLSPFAPYLIPVFLLATLGISTVGTLFSAMSAKTRTREVMFPLLFLPVSAPIVIAAVEATSLILEGGVLDDISGWLPMLVAFDAIFIVVCSAVFHIVVEE